MRPLIKWFPGTSSGQVLGAYLLLLTGAGGMAELADYWLWQQTHQLIWSQLGGILVFVLLGGLLIRWLLLKQSAETRALYRALGRTNLTDPLTGLPTRALLESHLAGQLAYARRHHLLLGVVLMDIDRLQEINDAMGHRTGDMVLGAFTRFITKHTRQSDFLARVGGDEIALATLAHSVDELLFLLEKLRGTHELILDNDTAPVVIDTSIGLAFYPDHCQSVNGLIKQAHTAMLHAKLLKQDFSVYDPALQRYSEQRINLFAELKKAIEQDELQLHYQPQLRLETGQVEGVEALARWPREDNTQLRTPCEFLSLAEQSRLLKPFSYNIIRNAIDQCAAWHSNLDLSVSINLSARNLLDDRLVHHVDDCLRRTGVPARNIVFEITENMLIQQPQQSLATLEGLHEIGCRLSLDDFGTGYASLSYLQNLPFDELKVDQCFIRSLHKRKNRAIVTMILQLAREFSFTTVAEGIETETIYEILRGMGAHIGQGYYFSKPRPANEIEAWIAQRHQ